MAGNQININGWYDKRNTGDESYKLAFPLLFNRPFIFSDAPIAGFDQYILGGGDIIAPYFLETFSKINATKHIMSVSMPEKINIESMKQFSTIIVRDEQSLINATKVGLNAILAPDFAFALQGDANRGRTLLKDYFLRENSEMYQNVIGLIVNAHLMTSLESSASDFIHFENFCYDLARVMDNTNASFVLIPFGKSMPWDDRASNSLVSSRCKFYKKNACIYADLNVRDTLDIIAAVDCVISTRLHSTIFSIISGTPFIDITHNHKNKNLLKTLSIEKYSLPYKQINSEIIQERINVTNSLKNDIKKNLTTISNNQRILLHEVVKNVHLD